MNPFLDSDATFDMFAEGLVLYHMWWMTWLKMLHRMHGEQAKLLMQQLIAKEQRASQMRPVYH